MSTDSPPPSQDVLRKTTEELAHFAKWVAELIRSRNWFTLLLLIDAALILFVNPHFLKSFFKISLPDEYTSLFPFLVGIIFVAAVIVAVRTKPPLSTTDKADFIEREAIKGLRAFTKDDAEIFSKLQRERSLQDCLNSITNSSFRFGILMGETGCGKTSFLQAGLLPKLLTESATHRGVYVRFANDEPVATVRKAFTEQLKLSKEELQDSDFLTLLSQATKGASKPLILIFDQFEQFFVHFKQKTDREPFLNALKQWYSAPSKVKIVFAIRSDLYFRMDELQRALNYSPGNNEVFPLEKFSPEEAAKVLEVIAETEKLEFDKSFVKELAEKQLANQDGLISPVDLQILCWMIEKQKTSELRAFNRLAFLKFGGIEGLLTRFLQRTLDTIITSAQRQAAVKVLLALTDLERQLRAGMLSLAELQSKLKGDISAAEVQQAVTWLARGDVRLITPVENEGKTGYELAHEKLIPALTRLAGKELSDADKANQLLDRRVNEWLGNNCSSRYLFSLRELWLIERQKPYLMWGSNRSQKEKLLTKSRRRYQGYTAIFTVVLLVVVSVFSWLQTPGGQIQQVRWELESLSKRVSDRYVGGTAIAFVKDDNLKLALKIIDNQIQEDSFAKASALSEIAKIYIKLEKEDKAIALLEKALNAANQIQDSNKKASVLSSIAEAYAKLNSSEKAIPLLEKALKAANQIQDSNKKASVLTSIAEAYAKLNSSDKAISLLEKALKAVNQIQYSHSKASVLTSIAETSAKLNSSEKAISLLEKALKAANQIQDSSYKAWVLTSIAEAYAKLNSSDKAISLLEKVLKAANQIQDSSYKASVLTSIAETSAKLNSSDKAIALLEKALKAANQIQDSSYKAWVLTSIAEAYAKLNSSEKAISLLEKALKVANQIQDSNKKASVLTSIAEAYAKLNSSEKAIPLLEKVLKAANQIQDSNKKAWVLTSIAETSAKLNSSEKAISLLEKALKAANQIQDSSSKAWVLTSIAETSAKLNSSEKAISLLEKALKAANQIQDSSSKASVLTSIAETSAKLKNWRLARDAFTKCPTDDCKVESRAKVLTIWAEKKNPALVELDEEE
ncbi:NACHT domain protein [Rivularia sp. PCC 7116]|uniref:tetratricopeptide repeat protein n=1 Tax=Rivularia sp. PCC 7116 TaxID=373994 RepID=UPI00029F0F44|nr:tetratricopeptide repeat protein [Rivularia sp. PCC 7116]AFY57832.1 NACHT domain protein [Rivularia sp. PCC 7116]